MGSEKANDGEEIESKKGNGQGFRKGRITLLLGRISHARILPGCPAAWLLKKIGKKETQD